MAFLTTGGYRDLIFADSAAQAFTYLGIAGKPFTAAEVDLIIIDIQMAGTDGIEATQTIKSKSVGARGHVLSYQFFLSRSDRT